MKAIKAMLTAIIIDKIKLNFFNPNIFCIFLEKNLEIKVTIAISVKNNPILPKFNSFVYEVKKLFTAPWQNVAKKNTQAIITPLYD